MGFLVELLLEFLPEKVNTLRAPVTSDALWAVVLLLVSGGPHAA